MAVGAGGADISLTEDVQLRPATLDDLDVLAYQRRAMFEATGLLDPADGPPLEAAVQRYLREAMPAGTFRGWLVEHGPRAVAGGGLQLRTLMPRPGYLQGEPEGLIVSMWTEPAYRRRGLGRRVLEAMLHWAREHNLRRLTLHASSDGQPLYRLYGFKPTNEMRLELDLT